MEKIKDMIADSHRESEANRTINHLKVQYGLLRDSENLSLNFNLYLSLALRSSRVRDPGTVLVFFPSYVIHCLVCFDYCLKRMFLIASIYYFYSLFIISGNFAWPRYNRPLQRL